MKKTVFTILFGLLLMPAMAQEKNLLENGDFEIAQEKNFLGTNRVEFEDWTYDGGMEVLSIEKNDVKKGTQVLKVNGAKMAKQTASLSQDVRLVVLGDTVGQAYELTIHYKTITANEGDIYLNSVWEFDGKEDYPAHDADRLEQVLPNSTEWREVKVNTTLPVGGTTLRVSVGMKKSVEVLFDDFSLVRVSSPATSLNEVNVDELLRNGEVEIYTLSGQRVNVLQSGVNIIRQGGKSYKVVR